MSNFIPAKRKLVEKAFPKFARDADLGYQIGKGYDKMMNPKLPAMPDIPAPPTIDDAQKNRDQQDRLRRRRGVLANIFGGGSQTLGGT